MQADQIPSITINGSHYEVSQLSQEGKKLVALLTEAQNELERLDVRRELLQASQQHLLSLLKPLLPAPIQPTANQGSKVLGKASDVIPTTPVTPPDTNPAPFPKNLPEAFKAQS